MEYYQERGKVADAPYDEIAEMDKRVYFLDVLFFFEAVHDLFEF